MVTSFVCIVVFLLGFAAVLMTLVATIGLAIGFTTIVKQEDKVANLKMDYEEVDQRTCE